MNESITNYVGFSDSTIKLTTSVDLSEFNNEKLLSLSLYLTTFKQSQKRLADEIFISSQQMFLMEQLLGSKIFQFAEEEFGLKHRTVRRYLHTYNMLASHITTDGRIAVDEARQFTRSALLLLSTDTAEEVILEIRNIAQSGTIVNEATVKRLLDEQSGDFESKMSASQAEISANKKNLASLNEKLELSQARLNTVQSNSAEKERRLSLQVEELEAEINKLKEGEIQVVNKEVEVVPSGFKSIQEAITSENIKHHEIQKKIAEFIEEKKTLEQELTLIRDSFKVLQVSSEDVAKFRSEIESAFLKMPYSRLLALSQADVGIASMLKEVGNDLISRGQQLCQFQSA